MGKKDNKFKSLDKIEDPVKREKLKQLYSDPEFPDNYGDIILNGWLDKINEIIREC